jgi:amidase
MTTFIERCEIGTGGTRVAVKDLIDVAGLPTTGGCRAIALAAEAAEADAACLAGVRAAVERGEARIVGKANLDELAAGATGINEWFGAVANPLDPDLVTGGSSSGCAAAVAVGEADVGIGTDTGGSVRIPAACCGIVGLKTTHGRVPIAGVLPHCPSLDTVGPLARDVAGAVAGMRLLEPGFEPAPAPAATVGRVRLPNVAPAIDAAVDRALAESELEVVEIELPGWASATEATIAIASMEALRTHGPLLDRDPENVGERTRAGLESGRSLEPAESPARYFQGRWLSELERAFAQAELLALPTLADFPVPTTEAAGIYALLHTLELNLAGVPAIALPILAEASRVPASLQLFGPRLAEELLITTAAVIESAAPGIS